MLDFGQTMVRGLFVFLLAFTAWCVTLPPQIVAASVQEKLAWAITWRRWIVAAILLFLLASTQTGRIVFWITTAAFAYYTLRVFGPLICLLYRIFRPSESTWLDDVVAGL